MTDIILKEESYKIIGACMEVHRLLGMGFKEVVYKDALTLEFNNRAIPFTREQKFEITYKGVELAHKYFAIFIIYDSIILEVKSVPLIVNSFVAQTINYLKASGLQLGIIVNFGEKSLLSKRVAF